MKKIILLVLLSLSFISFASAQSGSATLWVPFAGAPPVREFGFSLNAGYQDYIMTQETSPQGLGLIPWIPFQFSGQAEARILSEPSGFLEQINVRIGVLVNADTILPFLVEVDLIAEQLFPGFRLALTPSFITGYENNAAGAKIYGSGSIGRFFFTQGVQLGAHIFLDRSEFFYSAFGGMGMDLIAGSLSLSLEGSSDFLRRHKVAAILTSRFEKISLAGGLSWNISPDNQEPGFLIQIAY